MKKINIKARIKRNMLVELAGKYFRDEDSELIKRLSNESKAALVGIQREDDLYTVIGYDKVYYSSASGSENEILLTDFLDILSKTALSNGKSHHYEFIEINNNESIWMMNPKTMNALWNTMLLFVV